MGAAVEPGGRPAARVSLEPVRLSALAQVLTLPEHQQFLSHGWSRLGRGLGI